MIEIKFFRIQHSLPMSIVPIPKILTKLLGIFVLQYILPCVLRLVMVMNSAAIRLTLWFYNCSKRESENDCFPRKRRFHLDGQIKLRRYCGRQRTHTRYGVIHFQSAEAKTERGQGLVW